MTTAIEIVFWVCVALIGYAYAIYPIVVWTLSRLFGRSPVSARDLADHELPTVSLLIAAHNEEQVIARRLENALALDYPADRLEIVIASDGSSDATPRIVCARAEQPLPSGVVLRLVQHTPNKGKGAAIRDGMLAASGEFVFFLDADLASPPEEALKLLARLEAGADVAIGNRVQPDGSDMRASQPAQRRFVGRVFTTMRKALGVLADIDDTQCPLKGFRREVAGAVFEEQTLTGWTFDAEVLCIARSLGYRIEQVPVRWRHVEGSRLRVRPAQALEVARDLWRLRQRHPNRRPRSAAERV